MDHIVDNVNKLELTFKTIDLEGRVPSTDAIEFLSVEEPYREGRRYSPFVRVRYALNGVKQDKAFPMDVDKGIFLSIDDDALEEKLRKIAPKIVEILNSIPEIGQVYDQTWSVDKEIEFKVPISNNPDIVSVHGPLLGLYYNWIEDDGILEIKGKPSRQTSGEFTIIVKKGNQETKKSVSFEII